MSQHINPTPKQTDVDSVNSKIGNVGSTDLQAQITALNSKLADFVKYKTETVTIDNNGYFSTTLETDGHKIISVVSFFCEGIYRNAFRYDLLEYGGMSNKYFAFRFFYWNDTIIGKNESATVKYAYIEI